jgi:hypothetical protein
MLKIQKSKTKIAQKWDSQKRTKNGNSDKKEMAPIKIISIKYQIKMQGK